MAALAIVAYFQVIVINYEAGQLDVSDKMKAA
jgi:hypothetical protein